MCAERESPTSRRGSIMGGGQKFGILQAPITLYNHPMNETVFIHSISRKTLNDFLVGLIERIKYYTSPTK